MRPTSLGSLDEPVGRVQRHQLFVRRQLGADGRRLEQHRQRQHARLFARDRECRDQFLRRRGGRLDHPRGQRRAPRSGLELDLAGGDAAGDFRRAGDARSDRDDSSSASSTSGANQNGASPSAMLANLQSALATYEASPTSSSAAEAVVSAACDLAASLNTGERDGRSRCASRPTRHGVVGQHDQFAARASSPPPTTPSSPGFRPAPTSPAPRTRAIRS